MPLLGANTDLIKSDKLREAQLMMQGHAERYDHAVRAATPLGEIRCTTDEDIRTSVEAYVEKIQGLTAAIERLSGGDIENVDAIAAAFEGIEEINSGTANIGTRSNH